MIVYVDTCVFRDYIERRKSRFLPIDEFAEGVFREGLSCKYSFMCSDWMLYQLKELDDNPIKSDLFEEMEEKDKIIHVAVCRKDKEQAREYDTDYEDAVHARIAINNGASLLVTRNLSHYGCFNGNGITVTLPEHITYHVGQ
jgi:hypothetical protein